MPSATESNCCQWFNWFQLWMLDRGISVSNTEELPGRGALAGDIGALFELRGEEVFVTPDGNSLSDIVEAFERENRVPGQGDASQVSRDLYKHLRLSCRSMNPRELMINNWWEFERSAFCVIGAALHVGTCALHKGCLDGPQDFSTATLNQKKRLGLPLWLASLGALPQPGLSPVTLGVMEPTSAYYPFAGSAGWKSIFSDSFIAELSPHLLCDLPIFIKCGVSSPCDYIYLYLLKVLQADGSSKRTWVPIICDAKHTTQHGSQYVLKDHVQQLLGACLNLFGSLTTHGIAVSESVKLYIITNRNPLPEEETPQLKAVRQFCPSATVEYLTRDTFEFQPFTDVMFARLDHQGDNDG